MRTVDFKGREAPDLRSAFGDLPLVEATDSMIVYVSKTERDDSTRGDPRNCMFSQACKRAFGSKAVLFYPTVAYVDLVDEDGRRVVMRFRVTPKARAAIEKFDQDENPEVEGTFRLAAMPKTQQLKVQAQRARVRNRKIKSGELQVSERRSDGARKAARTRRDRALMGMRVGSPVGPIE